MLLLNEISVTLYTDLLFAIRDYNPVIQMSSLAAKLKLRSHYVSMK